MRKVKESRFETWLDCADAIGISAAYMSGIIHGTREPNELVLLFFRLERKVIYVKEESSNA
jgi:hypothetical protein